MILSGLPSENITANRDKQRSYSKGLTGFDLVLDFKQIKINDIEGNVEFFNVCHHITDSSTIGLVTTVLRTT